MQVVYTGPFDAVEVPELAVAVERGKPLEVPDEAGQRLCEQECWEQAARASRGKESN